MAKSSEMSMPNLNAQRSQRVFFALLVFSVVVISFVYGLVRGTRTQAHARARYYSAEQLEFTRLVIPNGVELSPMGNDIQISGRPGEAASFVTDRDVKSLLQEETNRLQAQGMIASGIATRRRGVVMAVDKNTNARHLMVAYYVPPPLRAQLSNGYPVYGFLSAVGAETDVAGSTGGIPDFPVIPGSRSAGLFSAKDPGGRSYSGMYTASVPLADAERFYIDELASRGWRIDDRGIGARSGVNFGRLVFRRGKEEATVLLSTAPGSDEQTLALISVGAADVEG